MVISTVYNNFSRGKIDHDLNGRFDLPVYTTGADVFKNFYSNFKGNGIFRGGFENMLKFQDCAFLEFRFNAEQNYLCVMYANEMKFLTYDASGNFGFVQSGGSDLVVATPYTLAESKEISRNHANQVSQSGDLMYIAHKNHEPRKLTRVSATSFTLATYTRTADPFTGSGDYPGCVALYEGAAYFASTDNKATTIWRSKIGDFDDMTVGTADDDGFEVAVAGLTESILWIAKGSNSLIAGSSQGLIPVNGGSPNDAITPSNVTTKISDVDGSSNSVPVRKEALLFYINAQQRNLNYFNYDIIQETFQSRDANLASYDITKGKLDQLVYKKDRNNLIWSLREGKDLVSLNFNLEESIVGWHEHTGQADFKELSRMSDNEGNVQLFALLEFDSDFFICRLSEELEFPLKSTFYSGPDNQEADTQAYTFFISEKLKEANHLDVSQFVNNLFTTTITYTGDTAVNSLGTINSTGTEFSSGDVGRQISYRTQTGREYGIFEITGFTSTSEVSVKVLYEPTALTFSEWYLSFDTISGLTDYIGQTISVVADGGYLNDYEVDGTAEIDLGKQVTSAVFGYGYEGLIKTFSLGFMNSKGANTQATPKQVYNSYLRFISSAGGEIGTDLYDMENIQVFDTDGYYDNPPIPIDGMSQQIIYSDSAEIDKFVFIRQSLPLPFQITGVFTEVSYTMDL